MTPPAAEPRGEMLALATARIRDAGLSAPLCVDGAADLVAVCRELAARGLTQALVRDRSGPVERLGLFATTDLRDALLRPEPPHRLPVREVANFELFEVSADADLVHAFCLMLRHRERRLVVRDGDAPESPVLGVLEPSDLMSLVANHPYLLAMQIDAAADVAELRVASVRIDETVRLLHGSGIRIERIARLVSELNNRLFARLWTLLAPPEVVRQTCLLVMGSEGRGEQILKTDQDNGLVMRDGFEWPGLALLASEFNGALAELGYPPCPGEIMLTNPLWRQSMTALRETMRGWVYGGGLGPSPDGPMHLAIFFDAVAVAGDTTLLADARAHLDQMLAGQDLYVARLAAAADQFQEPGHWLRRLTSRRDEQPLDLKKLGTFPIVHGVRALALQHGVREPGTAARLRRLAALQRIDADLARDLVDALHLLMGLRLTHQLRQRAQGAAPGNEIRPSELGTLEREPLRDALSIVRRFRLFLRQHFKFDAL